MSHGNAHGTVVVSIDLELDLLERSDWLRQRALAELTPQLAELCAAHLIPATWAVADPAMSAATDVIRGMTGPQEIALLGDATWIGPTAGPLRFERELARRVLHAREVGVKVSSLLLRGVELSQANWQSLAGHGITAVRNDLQRISADESKIVHCGICEFPVNGVLPIRGRWWSRFRTKLAIRGAIDETAQLGGLYHLAIDTPALLALGDHAIPAIGGIFRKISDLSADGQLSVETLAAAAARLGRTHSVPPAASILRAA